MNTTHRQLTAAALAALLWSGLAACGAEATAPQIATVVDAPAANVPQEESGFGPRKEHWPSVTDEPTADPFGESGFGPRKEHWPTADPYGESGFGPRR